MRPGKRLIYLAPAPPTRIDRMGYDNSTILRRVFDKVGRNPFFVCDIKAVLPEGTQFPHKDLKGHRCIERVGKTDNGRVQWRITPEMATRLEKEKNAGVSCAVTD